MTIPRLRLSPMVHRVLVSREDADQIADAIDMAIDVGRLQQTDKPEFSEAALDEDSVWW